MLLLVILGIAKVEYLHFDTGRESALAGCELIDALRHRPEEYAGVAAVLLVFPLDDQLEIGDLLFGANDTDRFAGALDGVALE